MTSERCARYEIYKKADSAFRQGDDDVRAADILLAHGADPREHTRIDDCKTPLEVAEGAGHARVAGTLRRAMERQ